MKKWGAKKTKIINFTFSSSAQPFCCDIQESGRRHFGMLKEWERGGGTLFCEFRLHCVPFSCPPPLSRQKWRRRPRKEEGLDSGLVPWLSSSPPFRRRRWRPSSDVLLSLDFHFPSRSLSLASLLSRLFLSCLPPLFF